MQSRVSIVVFNLHGQVVIRLREEETEAGNYSEIWNAETSPAGIYLIRISAGDYKAVRRAVLVK